MHVGHAEQGGEFTGNFLRPIFPGPPFLGFEENTFAILPKPVFALGTKLLQVQGRFRIDRADAIHFLGDLLDKLLSLRDADLAREEFGEEGVAGFCEGAGFVHVCLDESKQRGDPLSECHRQLG